MAIRPTPEQFQTLMEGPADTPVVMVNLLTFKKEASDADAGVSGQEAYGRYAVEMRKFVESKGGRFIWAGRVDSMVIGESDEEFHVVALVEYPNRATFVEIASSDHVAKIGEHRSAGLESQWLIATTETGLGD